MRSLMLTNTEVAQAKKGATTYKITDGAGLYLEVTRSGGKLWRYRFRLHGKESLFSLGEAQHRSDHHHI